MTLSNKRQKKIVKKMKKACRTRWLSLHPGANAVFDEYKGLVKTLQKIQPDRSSGSLATGLLQKIKDHEFLGTLYLLKFMLPNLSALSKTEVLIIPESYPQSTDVKRKFKKLKEREMFGLSLKKI